LGRSPLPVSKAPHSIPVAESKSTCRLRPARIDEAAALTDLALLSKASWGYEPAFMARCRAGMVIRPTAIRRQPFVVAEDFGLLLGFYGFGREADELNLDWLFVHPDHLGKGIGKMLFRHAEAWARGAGWREMMVVADPHAEDFYRHLGATPAGARASELFPGRHLPVLRFRLG
jgi:GNAT superfamily N-acetyltransferase